MSLKFEQAISQQPTSLEYGGLYATSAAAARNRRNLLEKGQSIFEQSGVWELSNRLMARKPDVTRGGLQVYSDGVVMSAIEYGRVKDEAKGYQYHSQIRLIAHTVEPTEIVIESANDVISLTQDVWHNTKQVEEVFTSAYLSPTRIYSALKE